MYTASVTQEGVTQEMCVLRKRVSIIPLFSTIKKLIHIHILLSVISLIPKMADHWQIIVAPL